MLHEDTKRAVYYTRVSTKEQAVSGYSLGAQQKIIADYCKSKGYELIGGYSDEGISGKTIEDRDQLQDLLEDSSDDEFDVVIIWKLSRLSRRLMDTLTIIEELNQNGVELDCVSEKIDFKSSSGRLSTQIMASMNEFHRNVIAENVALGHKEKARKGSWNGNKVFGYDNVKQKSRGTSLVVNDKEAKVVQMIYTAYLSGQGLRAIANDLNHKGYTTKRGNHFSTIAIQDILDNRLYRGDIVYGKKAQNIKELQGNPIVTKGLHEAIVDPKTWDKVAQLRQLRARNPEKSRTGANVLTGIIKCPQCGGHMVINNSYYTLKDGTKVHKKYYVCGAFKNKGAIVCSSNGINAETAEQKVAERFAELIDSKDLLQHLLNKMQESTTEGKSQLIEKQQLLTNQIIRFSDKILDYERKVKTDSDLADIWQQAIDRLEAEMDEVKADISAITYRLKKDYTDYDIHQLTLLVTTLVETAQSTTDKSLLKDVYLAFVKEIQWDKETQKFDILLYFDEDNIAEYLGIKPHPDPDNQTQNNANERNSYRTEDLPDGGFFLRRPIEIWV